MEWKLTFEDRAAMVIREIIRRNSLSNSRLGKIMRCSKNTINNYKNSIIAPSTEFIGLMADYYGVNVHWLHSGEGNPFDGDGTGPREPPEEDDEPIGYPPPGGDESDAPGDEVVMEPSAEYFPKVESKISSSMSKATYVLDSGPEIAEILLENIDATERTIIGEWRIIKERHEMERTRAEMKSMADRRKRKNPER